MDNNWVGYEKLPYKAKNCKHKYGNGDELADCYAEVIARYVCEKNFLQ